MTQRVTISSVNKALQKAGLPERLAIAKGYFYFYEGTAPLWKDSGVYVSSLNELTVDEWVAECVMMKEANHDRY